METKSLNRDQQRTQTPANVLDVANLKAQRSLLTARIVGSRGEARRALVQRLRAPEVLAFVANEASAVPSGWRSSRRSRTCIC